MENYISKETQNRPQSSQTHIVYPEEYRIVMIERIVRLSQNEIKHYSEEIEKFNYCEII